MAEYILRKFDRQNTETLNTLKLWWGKKVGAVLSDAVFSDYGYVLASDEGENLVAAFLYPVNGCAMAMIGFPIANPDIDKELRQKALGLLTTCIEKEAKRLNYKFLVSYAGSEGAKALFGREGYMVMDKDVTNFGKVL